MHVSLTNAATIILNHLAYLLSALVCFPQSFSTQSDAPLWYFSRQENQYINRLNVCVFFFVCFWRFMILFLWSTTVFFFFLFFEKMPFAIGRSLNFDIITYNYSLVFDIITYNYSSLRINYVPPVHVIYGGSSIQEDGGFLWVICLPM